MGGGASASPRRCAKGPDGGGTAAPGRRCPKVPTGGASRLTRCHTCHGRRLRSVLRFGSGCSAFASTGDGAAAGACPFIVRNAAMSISKGERLAIRTRPLLGPPGGGRSYCGRTAHEGRGAIRRPVGRTQRRRRHPCLHRRRQDRPCHGSLAGRCGRSTTHRTRQGATRSANAARSCRASLRFPSR